MKSVATKADLDGDAISKIDTPNLSPVNGVSGKNYSKEELDKFYNILHQYERGDMQTFTVEQIHNQIRESLSLK